LLFFGIASINTEVFCVLYGGNHQLEGALKEQIHPHLREWVATELTLIGRCECSLVDWRDTWETFWWQGYHRHRGWANGCFL